MNPLQKVVTEEFRKLFGKDPAFVVRAPGRVNLIGEHTDYNEGFVMPMAIDRATWIALSPSRDATVTLHSLDHHETATFAASMVNRDAMSWREYPKGVAFALKEAGYTLCGWDGVTACDVPMGAGLSSSASYELAVARAFCAVSGFTWDAPRMALLCQKAENEWVGVKCGIMDQMISAVGEQGKATLIDCRDLSREASPLPPGTSVVIMDTMTRRGLVDSAYNERRRQCAEAAACLGVSVLRDATEPQLVAKKSDMDPVAFRRARHVITENQRTVEATRVMARGDAAALGQLMNASHNSLRDDFEVTNGELDQIVLIARKQEGCFGARMTGAGFGGCAVALVTTANVSAFVRWVSKEYAMACGKSAQLYVTPAVAGASVIER